MAEVEQMTQREFNGWIEYYKNFPFDDLHRYHRPAALISVCMNGGDFAERINFLQPEMVPEGLSDADIRTMKAFGIKPSMKP